jgi:hypothetical protein
VKEREAAQRQASSCGGRCEHHQRVLELQAVVKELRERLQAMQGMHGE